MLRQLFQFKPTLVLSLEPYKSHLPEDERVSIRVASSAGNSVLRSLDGDDLSGHVLRGGAISPNPEKTGFTFQPYDNKTIVQLWSNDFHLYELIWQRGRITVKVDGKIYGFDGTPTRTIDQPVK